MNDHTLNGKTVFITGAASGIGAATALAFSAQGCRLVLADLNTKLLQNTLANLEENGGKAHAIALDVTDRVHYMEVAADLCDTIGVPDVVVNNAGIGALGSFLNTPVDVTRRIFEVNLFGVMNGCHAFLPRMLEDGKRRQLVNVASMASISPMPNMSSYAASKYAVDGLSETLALELADSQIDVICVHPGVINTPIVEGRSYNPGDNSEQLQRLSTFYQKKGSPPSVVAADILRAVKRRQVHLHTGAGARWTALLKRLSPALLRKLTLSTAHRVGYA